MDEQQAVEEQIQDAAPEQGVESDSNAPGVNYEAEWAAQVEENARVAKQRDQALEEKDNYKEGLLFSKGKLKPEDLAAMVQREVDAKMKQILPSLQATVAEESFTSILGELSSDENERNLIKHHFESSVGTTGTIRERLENAKLIANKKTLFQTHKELKVALQNRSQVSSSALGTNNEQPDVTTKKVTREQEDYFKKRGWDQGMINKYLENYDKQGVR